jgi:hypothetical protein
LGSPCGIKDLTPLWKGGLVYSLPPGIGINPFTPVSLFPLKPVSARTSETGKSLLGIREDGGIPVEENGGMIPLALPRFPANFC